MADIVRGNVLSSSPVFQVALNGTVSRGDPIGQDGTGWVRADADAAVSCQAFAMMDGVSGDVITAAERCTQQTTTTLTIGGMVFLSTTAGRLADANPGTVTAMTHVLGYVAQASPTGLMVLDAKIPHEIAAFTANEATILIAAAGTAFYVARRPMRVLGVVESHSVACSSSGTFNIVKAATGVAVGAGTSVMVGGSAVAVNTTADTPVFTAPHATAATARLAVGDRLMCLIAGTLTALVDIHVSVQLVALER